MAQYHEIKAKHPGALLLFRVGDFYETFGEDAVHSSKILGITLTKRANGAASEVALAGFPHHALDTYLPKLIRAGQRVAICEQLEQPSIGKKIVKRGVTELVSPGAHMRESILEENKNNFLSAFAINGGSGALAFLDVSTGDFFVGEGTLDQLRQLIAGFSPNEVLLDKNDHETFHKVIGKSYYKTYLPDWVCTSNQSEKLLKEHFKVESLKGFSLQSNSPAVTASGMIIHYLKNNGHKRIEYISNLQLIHHSEFLWLDDFTLRNLEVVESNSSDGTALLHIVDAAVTPMGKRTVRRWLSAPSRNSEIIKSRHDRVDEMVADFLETRKLQENLEKLIDVERSTARLASQRIHPRELLHLGLSLKAINQTFDEISLPRSLNNWNFPAEAVDLIVNSLNEDAPVQIGKSFVFQKGVDTDLDDIRGVFENSQASLNRMLHEEVEKTGITSLKIGQNQVFGYHFEVRNTHKDKVPDHWQRKQTLVSAERYITPELKEFEEKIAKAESLWVDKERELFQNLLENLGRSIPSFQAAARFLGELDALHSWAIIAMDNSYVRPILLETHKVEIKGSRHPVIEQVLKDDEVFVPNDISLNNENDQLLIITGPNMAGKSAILRQVALTALLNQAGAFVPAESAELPIFDRLFVRVGASDNISQGESTFMVEMIEAASILNNLEGKCLVLLDEIGRGTSTYDGVSIAWAMASYLHEHPTKPLTLFATHYHELNEMQSEYPRIKNMNVSIKEDGESVHFLRKLVEGGSAHSFGIHVAKMAGMPQYVIGKAENILKSFEESRDNNSLEKIGESTNLQLSLIQMDDPLLHEIKSTVSNLDVENLTPIEALMVLNDLKKKLIEKK